MNFLIKSFMAISISLIVFIPNFLLAAKSKNNAKVSGVCEVTNSKSAYDFSVTDVEGKSKKLSDFKGKVALIVNTASKCGYTSQYKELQELFAKYKDQGFVVLGFPSNDFGAQEPGSNTDIKTFCETNFNVKFPLFAKGPVKGPSKQALYEFLTENSGDSYKGEIAWNFEKFLVNKSGQVVARYKSNVKPTDVEVTKLIETTISKESAACL